MHKLKNDISHDLFYSVTSKTANLTNFLEFYHNFRFNDQIPIKRIFLKSAQLSLSYEVLQVTFTMNSQKRFHESIGRFLFLFCNVITDMINKIKMLT